MASERQIAANQRNAQKSTGPKSKSGKKRSSMNAFRHGLSVPMPTDGSEAQLKKRMRQFAPGASDETSVALAERAAGAQLELARVRKTETAMIERALGKTQGSELLDSSMPLPGGNEEERRFVLAVQHSLPELTKTCPYEKRAAARRDRAIRMIVSIKTAKKKL